MRKTWKILFSLMMLTSCSGMENGATKKEALRLSSDPQVCSLGLLGTKPETRKNYLPTGFYGNDPQIGMVEIGGKAGDPYAQDLPDLYFSQLDANYPSTFYLSVAFQTSPLLFSENKEQKMLGLEMGIVDTDGKLLEKSTRRFSRRLSDNFNEKDDYAMGLYDNTVFSTVESIFKASKSIFVSFQLKRGQKLRYFRYYYGDTPVELNNACFCLSSVDEDKLALLPTQGEDCQNSLYTENVGCEPEYYLKSQYGSVYSIDYLKNAFIAKDRYDGTERHPDIIEDPNDYFNTGMRASLGTKYQVRFGSEDSQGNRSYITFHFTVVDEKGPTLSLINNKEVITSYATDFNSPQFFDAYFSIGDNCDPNPTKRITLSDESEIPENKIGTFACALHASDASGNESRFPFTMTLIDDIAPVLTASVDEINLTPFSNYNREKLLGMFTADDAIDGVTPITVVEDTYTGNRDKVGNYVFSVKTEDKSGNVATKTLTIRVQDTEGPVFYAKKSFITASKDNIPTVENIISSLIRQEVIPDKNYVKWTMLQGEEINSELSLGIHEFSLLLETDEKEAERVDITMNVVEKSSMSENTKEMTLWEKICLFFERLWKKIVAFFSK